MTTRTIDRARAMRSSASAVAGRFSRLPYAAQLAILIAGQVALWTVLSAVSQTAPPWDNIEELVWSAHPQWGYYKHPPMPAWILYAFTTVFGHGIWVTYLAAEACVAVGLAYVWRLGCAVTTPARALLATVLVSLVAYYNVRGMYFNHNTVQIPLVAAATFTFYRAVRDGRIRDWVGFGIAAGLCMLAKYSAALLFVAFGAYLLRRGRIAERRTARGLAAATATGLLVFSPHFAWIAAHHFEPIRYAAESTHLEGGQSFSQALSAAHFHALSGFLGSELARLAVFLAVAAWLARVSRRTDADAASAPRWNHPDDWEFLLYAGLGPLAVTLALGVLGGIYLESSWVTMYFGLFGLLALHWIRSGDDERTLARAIRATVVLQVVTAVALAFTSAVLLDRLGRASRNNYPGPALARAAAAFWRAHQPGPFALLIGDTWMGGNVVEALRPHGPRLIIDGSFAKTTWISPQSLQTCGALVLVDRSPKANMISTDTASLAAQLARATVRGRIDIPWGTRANGPRVIADWGILPAQDPQRCAALRNGDQ